MSDLDGNFELFLQCFIFTALKARGVYPSSTFLRRPLFGRLCLWSACPTLEDYVSRLCESLRKVLLHSSCLRRVRVQFCKGDGTHDTSSGSRCAAVPTPGCYPPENVAIEFASRLEALERLSLDEVSHSLGSSLERLETSLAVLWPASGASGSTTSTSSTAWTVQVETSRQRRRGEERGDAAAAPLPIEAQMAPRWQVVKCQTSNRAHAVGGERRRIGAGLVRPLARVTSVAEAGGGSGAGTASAFSSDPAGGGVVVLNLVAELSKPAQSARGESGRPAKAQRLAAGE